MMAFTIQMAVTAIATPTNMPMKASTNAKKNELGMKVIKGEMHFNKHTNESTYNKIDIKGKTHIFRETLTIIECTRHERHSEKVKKIHDFHEGSP